MADPGFVTIYHPETRNTADVPNEGNALAHYWRAGWVPLTDENAPEAEAEPPPPEPMTPAQVADMAAEPPASKSTKSSKE